MIILLIAYSCVYAQNPNIEIEKPIDLSYEDAMQIIFGALDFSKIPTGILKERSVQLSEWGNFNGNDSTTFLTKDSLLQVYSELYHAQFNKNVLINDVFKIDSIANDIIKNSGQIPLLLLHFNYQQFKQEALDNNWIIVDGMQLKDVSPIGQTPYEEKTIFAMAPLSYEASDPATFVLPSSFVFSNAGTYNSIEADFNDGAGYRTIIPDQPFTVSLPLSNVIEANFRITTTYDTLTSIGVTLNSSQSAQTLSSEPLPDAVYEIISPGELINQFGVWRGCNNTCIRKPIIVIEGFDPTNNRTLDDNASLDCSLPPAERKSKNLYGLVNAEGMADKFRAAGYDIVILNYADGMQSLQYKADIVKQLIGILKDSIAVCGSNEQFVIIAPSEGALVGRYALADMEGRNIDHNTRLFISYDGAMQGAYIPLSFQYFVDFVYKKTPLLWVIGYVFNEAKMPIEVLKSIPTKQMLTYHYENFPAPAIEHVNFFNELKNLNGGQGYPIKCRKIAISNGSGNGINQGFNPLDKLFAYNITTGAYNLYTDGWALPNGGNKEKIFSGIAIKTILSLNPFSIEIVKVGGTKPFDNAPGGHISSTGDIKYNLDKYAAAISTATVDDGRTMQDFIPTTSALDLKNTSGDLFYNVHSNITGSSGIGFKGINYSASVSPFDAIYVSTQNDDHVICGTTPSIAQFVEDEVMSINLYLQNETITQARDMEAVETVTTGRNVTNRKPQGDFVVANNSGPVKIAAGQQIISKLGTSITPAGTGSVHLFIDEERFENCQISCRSLATNVNNDVKNSAIEAYAKNKKDKEALSVNGKLKEGKFYSYPNPCTDHTHIEYKIGETANVNLVIYNSKGQLVETIVKNQAQNKGVYNYTLNTSGLVAGTYVCVLKINQKITERKKIIVVK